MIGLVVDVPTFDWAFNIGAPASENFFEFFFFLVPEERIRALKESIKKSPVEGTGGLYFLIMGVFIGYLISCNSDVDGFGFSDDLIGKAVENDHGKEFPDRFIITVISHVMNVGMDQI